MPARPSLSTCHWPLPSPNEPEEKFSDSSGFLQPISATLDNVMKTRWPATLLPLLVLAGGAVASEPAQGGSAAALDIARATRAEWRLGRLTIERREGRQPRIRAEVMSGGAVVARLRVDPATGGFLAKDERAQSSSASPEIARLRGDVERQLGRVEVGGWAWPSKHAQAWGVPLRYEGRVVGKLNVDLRQRKLLATRSDDNEDDD
jgi:hypothetical protein